MVPNFDTKHWDREKIIDWVIGDQPLDDQQLAFLDYFEELKAQQQSDRDSSTWWHNRYNAQVKINKKNEEIIKNIKDYVNFLVILDTSIAGKFSETPWGKDILGLIEED